MLPLTTAQGLALFDRARAAADALLVPIRLDPPPRRQGRPGPEHRAPRGGRGGHRARSLTERVTALPEADREAYVLDVVCAHVATVLGHESADAVEPERAFQELGFDS
ncbi:acyl carrier protein [Streptomyces sp. M19]